MGEFAKFYSILVERIQFRVSDFIAVAAYVGKHLGESAADAFKREFYEAVFGGVAGVDGSFVAEIVAVESAAVFALRIFLSHCRSPALYAVGMAVVHLFRFPQMRTCDDIGDCFDIIVDHLSENRQPNHVVVCAAAFVEALHGLGEILEYDFVVFAVYVVEDVQIVVLRVEFG